MWIKDWWDNEDQNTKKVTVGFKPTLGQTAVGAGGFGTASRFPPPPVPHLQRATKSDPLKPLATFENSEIFLIRKSTDIIAYLWLNFKENDDWRDMGDTLMIKASTMTMVQLRFKR